MQSFSPPGLHGVHSGMLLSLHNCDSCWIIEARVLSISGILLFDFVVPKGQLQTADASAGTETATECGNFPGFPLENSPGILESGAS